MIGSPAYQRTVHPDHKATRQFVTDWFALHYGHQPVQTDATGRLSAPNGKQTSLIISQIQHGATLFVGEGNLSFALSITEKSGVHPSQLVATTYEKANDLSDEAVANEQKLKQLGASVINGIDATKLDNAFPRQKFDTIVFQFPNTGSRSKIWTQSQFYSHSKLFEKCGRLSGTSRKDHGYRRRQSPLSGRLSI